MLTVRRVCEAYRHLGFAPAADVYLDEGQGRCCPVAAVCLAEHRLRARDLTPPIAWRNVIAALEEPSPYVIAFIDSVNRWHHLDWALHGTPAQIQPAADTDPALLLMRRGRRDGERVGMALLGPLPSASRRRTGGTR